MAFDYDMTERGSFTLYDYLYRCIRHDIESGQVDPGDRLPSKRAFAKRLRVSLVTVEKAYAQLTYEGYIHSRERRGYFVARLPKRTARPGLAHRDIAAAQAPLGIATQSRAGSSQASASAVLAAAPSSPSAPPSAFATAGAVSKPSSLSTSARDAAPYADFSWPASNPGVAAGLWSKALRATLAHEGDRELYAPQPSLGSLRLRRAIAAHLLSFRGMNVDPESIVVGAGAQMLYGQVAQLITAVRSGADGATGADGAAGAVRSGSRGSSRGARPDASPRRPVVALENPGYPRLASIYRSYGFDVRHVPLDREGIDMDELEASGADLVHIMPSHQFPTGRVTSVTRRYELLGWLVEGDRFLVEDDYDNEFRMAGRPIPPLASIDVLGRVVYIGTFSKSLGSALRLAYMVLPPALRAVYDDALGFYSSTVSVVDQICLARLLESGDYERHVNRYRKERRDVRDALLAALADSPAGARIHVEEADSGLHFVLAVESSASEGEIARIALRHGVRLAPMSRYVDDPSGPTPGYDDDMPRFVMQYDGLSLDAVPRCAQVLSATFLAAR